eukprot:4257251-Pyramimonas_sp.AAC.1
MQAPSNRSQAFDAALQWAGEVESTSGLANGGSARSESSVPPPDAIVELRGHQVLVSHGAM